MIREIVKIDEEKCNGCGDCVPTCAEGAIKIVDGKARLIADNLCDGLGACLGHCPMDAIVIERRDSDEFDEEAVEKHLHAEGKAAPAAQPAAAGGCPSARVMDLARPAGGGCPGSAVRNFAPVPESGGDGAPAVQASSELRQWPVQMHLVPPTAPFLRGADLVFAADCVPFAYPDFHRDFLRGKALLVGCPKLDDAQAYAAKLTEMVRLNDIRSITVLHMEVPCCSGLVALVKQALAASGKDVPLETVRIGIQGDRK
ncbi:MAG: ferredoxin [Desulfuromonas sp.]|uniref:ATP-binding protein n=1 Tax=Desulfuromonas sp. TaxID=892 RepID=UPI000CAA2FED|nr:4Fe-4S binding protein [Desulfuromonas sp.]PLX83341.1 MAG: ferredoxin [Desulfuromonas sp.]